MESSRPSDGHSLLPYGSAQRLAASMESSLIHFEVAGGIVLVLNALRHQWNPHLSQLHDAIVESQVLNALRHQWNPHRREDERQRREYSVLNALRHQWNPHFWHTITKYAPR